MELENDLSDTLSPETTNVRTINLEAEIIELKRMNKSLQEEMDGMSELVRKKVGESAAEESSGGKGEREKLEGEAKGRKWKVRNSVLSLLDA